MLWPLFYIIALFFSLGAIATTRLNKRGDIQHARARWIKYTFYLAIVLVTICSIWSGVLYLLAIVLLVIGAYEIISGWWASEQSPMFLVVSLGVYSLIAFGFYEFSHQTSPQAVLYVYTIIFTFDGFSQLIGQLFGKRKILPQISPQKTLAGIVGGYVIGVATGIFIQQWLDLPRYAIWFLPFLICTAAFVGDALASWYKRRCALKDYSNLIPGHGGILDRYDSFFFAGAVFWLCYSQGLI